MKAFENIRLTVDDGVALITISRPQAMNALNRATLEELCSALDETVEAGARAIVITGEGKAFVAGADIAAMRDMSADEAQAFGQLGNRLFRKLELSPLPVIAAVNGFALGGGCELALSCDFIYASEKAKFGQPEVQLGLIAGFGGTQRLPRKVPYGIAMELLLTGRMIDAAEASRIGLVNRVLPPDELLSTALSTAREILSKGPVAVRLTKRLVQRAPDFALDDGLEEEVGAFGAIFSTADRSEGLSAFLEKRSPNFQGS